MPSSFTDDSALCCDLFCGEDTGALSEDSAEGYCVAKFLDDSDESIAEFVESESSYSTGLDYLDRYQWRWLDAAAREEAVVWMLKVHVYYGFSPLTPYLAVNNYMDRFMSAHCLPQSNGWPLQLLAVACLSLGAKMEEVIVPSLLDLQIEEAKFIFDPRTICKMELLVLTALNWKLRSVTPFTFIDFFVYKADATGAYKTFLISRATQIILGTIHDIKFLHHCPSSLAAAAILCAANETPGIAPIDVATAAGWCIGLTEERISDCFRLMKGLANCTRPPQIIPHLRITSNTNLCSGSSSPVKKKIKMAE